MTHGRLLLVLALMSGASVAAVACGGKVVEGDFSSCPAGSQSCPCYANDTCDEGLTCTSDVCVDSGSGTDTGGRGGVGGSGGTGGSGGGGDACIAGQIEPCVGPGDCSGVRQCNTEGSGFGPCECAGPPVGGGPAAQCVPGTMGTCYGVGACLGTRICNVNATWGPCECEPGPTGGTGGMCIPGQIQPCLGPGACSGIQVCNSLGTGFGPCDCGAGGTGAVGGWAGAPPAGWGGMAGSAGAGAVGPVECVGEAAECTDREAVPAQGGAGGAGYTCTGGCIPVPQCSGMTSLGGEEILNCAQVENETDCEMFESCTWLGSTCNGIPKACALHRLGPPNNEEEACNAQPGCRVVPCRGEAIPCEDLPNSQCQDSPGCTLAGPW